MLENGILRKWETQFLYSEMGNADPHFIFLDLVELSTPAHIFLRVAFSSLIFVAWQQIQSNCKLTNAASPHPHSTGIIWSIWQYVRSIIGNTHIFSSRAFVIFRGKLNTSVGYFCVSEFLISAILLPGESSSDNPMAELHDAHFPLYNRYKISVYLGKLC